MPSSTVHTVRIGADGCSFQASSARPLLQSAHAAGLALPSSCRNGTCRSCIQQLASGRVHYRIEWPGLLAEEKAQGWILPCVAFPDTDLVLRNAADKASSTL